MIYPLDLHTNRLPEDTVLAVFDKMATYHMEIIARGWKTPTYMMLMCWETDERNNCAIICLTSSREEIDFEIQRVNRKKKAELLERGSDTLDSF